MGNLDKTAKQQTFESELGTKAHIKRHTIGEAPTVTRFSEELKEIGRKIKDEEGSLKDAVYLGSAAVHYYVYPALEQGAFVSQTPVAEVPEPLLQPGISDLRNELMRKFGRNPQRKRSGF